MRWVRVLEHGRLRVVEDAEDLAPDAITRAEFDRLGRADQWRGAAGGAVFDWRAHAVVARHWVGVVQVPGLGVEILPKIEDPGRTGDGVGFARRNLLTMLAVAGDLPLRERDLAELALQRMPVSETLMYLFARRLDEALRLGVEHGYVAEEADTHTLRGRLDLGRQLTRHAERLDRFAVRTERFCEDTPLNRVLKAACRALAGGLASGGALAALRRSLAVLDEVEDVPSEKLAEVQLTRQNERYRALLNFAQMILSQRSPTASSGRTRAFSLLFDMNRVFESFIARFMERHVMPSFPELDQRTQAKGRSRPLLTRGDVGVLNLRPDLMLTRGGDTALLIDTKWKRLDPATRAHRPSREDLYQLFAYAHRFRCARSILLYPQVGQVGHGADAGARYTVPTDGGAPPGAEIVVRFVNLGRDLRAQRGALAEELQGMIREELSGAPSAVAA